MSHCKSSIVISVIWLISRSLASELCGESLLYSSYHLSPPGQVLRHVIVKDVLLKINSGGPCCSTFGSGCLELQSVLIVHCGEDRGLVRDKDTESQQAKAKVNSEPRAMRKTPQHERWCLLETAVLKWKGFLNQSSAFSFLQWCMAWVQKWGAPCNSFLAITGR